MTECPVCGRDGCPGVYDGPVTESPIPEKAIEAAAKALSPGWDWITPESQDEYRQDAEDALQAALPALREQWEAEAVARIERLGGNLDWVKRPEVFRAIKQAPEQEDG